MASAHMQSFQSPTSSAGIKDSRQERRREIMDECEVTWENIQKVMQLNLSINKHLQNLLEWW